MLDLPQIYEAPGVLTPVQAYHDFDVKPVRSSHQWPMIVRNKALKEHFMNGYPGTKMVANTVGVPRLMSVHIPRF